MIDLQPIALPEQQGWLFYLFLFKQMILSSVAPEKHQHLVCCVYSEVTISKNSFLKNCPRRLGSTQAEW